VLVEGHLLVVNSVFQELGAGVGLMCRSHPPIWEPDPVSKWEARCAPGIGVDVEARPLVIVSVLGVCVGGDLARLLLAGVLTFPWALVIVSPKA